MLSTLRRRRSIVRTLCSRREKWGHYPPAVSTRKSYTQQFIICIHPTLTKTTQPTPTQPNPNPIIHQPSVFLSCIQFMSDCNMHDTGKINDTGNIGVDGHFGEISGYSPPPLSSRPALSSTCHDFPPSSNPLNLSAVQRRHPDTRRACLQTPFRTA